MNISKLIQALSQFRDERNWSQFHSLKNLIISLNLEASELLELTQWKEDEIVESMILNNAQQERLREECADVLLYLLLICDKAHIDLEGAAWEKLKKNAEKYPISLSHSSCQKYTEFDKT